MTDQTPDALTDYVQRLDDYAKRLEQRLAAVTKERDDANEAVRVMQQPHWCRRADAAESRLVVLEQALLALVTEMEQESATDTEDGNFSAAATTEVWTARVQSIVDAALSPEGARMTKKKEHAGLLGSTASGDAQGSTPRRIQRRRSKGWTMPENTVYVGRPTKWGNPFTVANAIDAGFARDESSARRLCVDAHAHWMRGGSEWDWATSDEKRAVRLANLKALRGKNLACWCPLDQPCHADVLLELANGEALGAQASTK